ncbi:hypothetical protein AWC14_08825 [Mycobacterium kyorinense]|uniref:Uncharacterized protein n=1 Tax=Mycobacterium kyorinense TaxID=487514 RepID=A0A1X1XQY7_9MYCO|nr:hypothetical protein AWC14_08825 [Mycobacterium kyorinense]
MFAAIVSSVLAPSGHTTIDEIALNGTYTAISDGQWAKTNEKYHDEATVISTWTITSSCTGIFDCIGRVTSDLGWSADARYVSGMWFVIHILDNWEHCADGSGAPARQVFKFYSDPNNKSAQLGWDTTTAASGACGRNRPLEIEMPFKLVPK